MLTPLLIAGLIAAFCGAAMAGGTSAKQMDRVIQKKVTQEYLVYLPDAYEKDSTAKFPLIIFLHGAGERGDDVQQVRVHGPIGYAEKQKDFPFIIAAPQCPTDGWWEPTPVMALLDEMKENYRVDADRVYLTGLSMGGFGTWSSALEYPDLFAAIAPICGKGNPNEAGRIKDVPTWAFHGAKDEVVPLSGSTDMINAMKNRGGNPKLTVYPEAGHDSWTESYNNPELYKWFLQHRLSDRVKPAPAGN